jgi:hypothetical protein
MSCRCSEGARPKSLAVSSSDRRTGRSGQVRVPNGRTARRPP